MGGWTKDVPAQGAANILQGKESRAQRVSQEGDWPASPLGAPGDRSPEPSLLRVTLRSHTSALGALPRGTQAPILGWERVCLRGPCCKVSGPAPSGQTWEFMHWAGGSFWSSRMYPRGLLLSTAEEELLPQLTYMPQTGITPHFSVAISNSVVPGRKERYGTPFLSCAGSGNI